MLDAICAHISTVLPFPSAIALSRPCAVAIRITYNLCAEATGPSLRKRC
jgi:hypothetical protein